MEDNSFKNDNKIEDGHGNGKTLKSKIIDIFAFLSKRFFLTAIVLIMLVAIIYVSLSEDGFIKTRGLKSESERLRVEIEILKDENRLLKERLERFKTDTDYLEDEARKKLGLIRPDEIIYSLGEESNLDFDKQLKSNLEEQDKKK